jgi:sarcosine oxidase subunit beta
LSLGTGNLIREMKNTEVYFQSELPQKADVVIVGGGVIGVVTAYYLAKAHYKVVLLESSDIGAGTTSAAAAAALLQTKTSSKKLEIASRSLALLEQLHQQLDGKFEFQHSGSLLVANNSEEMDLILEMNANLRNLGLDVDLVDRDQARGLMPVLGETVVGGSFSPRDAQINPLELVVASAEGARQHGVTLCNFTKVTGLEVERGNILSVKTTSGRVLTETVINAAGVWAPEVAGMAGLQLPIQPLKGELLVTERVPRMMQGTLIAAKYLMSKAKLEQDTKSNAMPERSVGITLVQVEHGNLIVGSTREPAGYDTTSTYGGIRDLISQLLELTPSLANLRLLRSYAGLRPLTSDGYPIISREPTLPGLIQATGFGGDGLAMSAITAEVILSLLEGQTEHKFQPSFSLARFDQAEAKS